MKTLKERREYYRSIEGTMTQEEIIQSMPDDELRANARFFHISAASQTENHPHDIVITHEDITDRKHIENKLKESEEKYRLIFENAPDAYFISDLSGMYSLYVMDRQGSITDPLLPSGIPLQNPHLMAGLNYLLFPKMGKILVMIDNFGAANYKPCFIPIYGGIPEPIFGESRKGQKIMFVGFDKKKNIVYFNIDDRKTPNIESIQVKLETMEVISFGF